MKQTTMNYIIHYFTKRIERWWRSLRQMGIGYWIDFFKNLEIQGYFTCGNQIMCKFFSHLRGFNCTEENVIAIFVCILVTLNKLHVYFIFFISYFLTENASDFALWELYRKNLIKLNMSGITILSEFSEEIL